MNESGGASYRRKARVEGAGTVWVDMMGGMLVRTQEILAYCYGTHRGGLSGSIPTAKTVTATALEAEGGGIQQDLGTVGE